MIPYGKYNTVTDGKVTKSQPIVSTSVTTSSETDYATLNVKRHYNDLVNQWGGRGRIKALDADGMKFPTSREAWAYAYSHGYIRVYFTSPELRNIRKARYANV